LGEGKKVSAVTKLTKNQRKKLRGGELPKSNKKAPKAIARLSRDKRETPSKRRKTEMEGRRKSSRSKPPVNYKDIDEKDFEGVNVASDAEVE
jgi:hypothetical protein